MSATPMQRADPRGRTAETAPRHGLGAVRLGRRAFLVAGLSGLAACAPAAQGPEHPLFGFGRPRLETDAFTSFDGSRLPTMVWRPTETRPAPEREVVIVALHGFDDYARAFEIAGPFWAARGATTYAYDQRGFGRAPERGLWPGQKALVEDLRVFCALVRQRHPGALIAVAGESMGGAVAIAAFASSSPPTADRLVLLSPAVWGWSEQPLTNEVGLWLLDHLDPGLSLTPPAFVASQHRCSDNERVLQEMDKDPLEINATRTDATCGLIDLMERASRDIAALRLPTLYLYGAKDTMIPKTAAFRAAARLGRRGRTAFYPEGWHLLDRDLQAGRVLADALGFIRDPLAPLPSRPGPIPAPETLTA